MIFNEFYEDICLLYKGSNHLWDKETPPDFVPDKYENLLFIHLSNEFSSRKRYSTLAQHMREDISDKEMIQNSCYKTNKIEEIFKQNKSDTSGEIILIIGVAGIGKTILCKEIAYRWAHKQLLEKDRLVLLVLLRNPEMQSMISIEDLVFHFHRELLGNENKEHSKILTKYLRNTKGKYLTIILDGYDELSDVEDKANIFQRLLRKKILPLCRIVVTSRPIAPNMDMLQKIASTHVEILGFTKENRQDFIDNGLKDNPKKLKSLNSYLIENKIIDRLCYIPFMLCLLVCITKEYDQLPKSRTEIYSKFIFYTISRFLQQYSVIKDNISQVNELPVKFKEYFLEICEYAYNAIHSDKIVFTAKEIKSDFPVIANAPGSWSGLGLLKAVRYFSFQEYRDCTSYNFLHLSIQEYLAAYYITTLSIKQQLSILKRYFFSEKYLNMWIMYTGLCGKPVALLHFLSGKRLCGINKFFVVHKISSTILQSKIKCLYLLQCLPELEDCKILNNISTLFESGKLDLSNHQLLPKDIDLLTSILDKSTTIYWKELNLSHCEIGDAGCHHLNDLDNTIKIDKIDLSSNELTSDSLKTITNIVIHCQTKRLNLSDNFDIHDTAVLHLATESTSKNIPKLLSIRVNDQENVVLKNLNEQRIISQMNIRWITALYFINCRFTKAVTNTLHYIIQSLNTLCVWNCYLRKDDISCLLLTMPQKTKNKFLCVCAKSSLVDNNFVAGNNVLIDNRFCNFMFMLLNDHSFILHKVNDLHIKYIILSPTLPETEKLSEIQMFNCEISAETAALLSKMFSQCSMIVRFILINTKFELPLLRQTISIIKKCQTLKAIYIEDLTNLRFDNFCVIADELSYDEVNFIMKFSNNYLSFCRNSDKQLNHSFEKWQWQTDSQPLMQNHVIYERNSSSNSKIVFKNKSNIYTSHIWVSKSKLVLTEINQELANHMITSSSSIEMINLTEIHLKHCHIHDITTAQLLFERFMECKELRTFMYSENIMGNYKVLENFLHKLIALPVPSLRKLHIYESHLHSDYITALQKALCNKPKLETVIKNSDLLMGSRCSIRKYDKQMFQENQNSYISNVTAISLQYCQINLLVLSRILHFFQYTEVVIENSLIYSEEIQSLHSISTKLIKSISLQHNQITEDALKVLMSIIMNSSKLKELFLVNNQIKSRINEILGENMNPLFHKELCLFGDLAQALSNKRYLQTLQLNEPYLKSTTIVVKALATTSRLQELSLNCIGHRSNSKNLALNISSMVENNNSLKKLFLADNNLKVEDIIYISKSLCKISSLEILELQNNIMTEEAAEEIASVILSNTGIKELYLGNNHLQAGVIKISRALKKISSLKILDLENNQLSEKVVDELASAISAINSLEKLWLDNNNLASSITKLAMACSKHSKLKQISMGNIGISEKDGKEIATIIKSNVAINKLSIFENNLLSSGFIPICQSLLEVQTMSLTLLNAYSINVTTTVSEELTKVISKNESLEEILLGDNLIENGLMQITQSCSKLKELRFLELSHNSVNPACIINLVSNINESSSLESLSLGGIVLTIHENLCLNVSEFNNQNYSLKKSGDISENQQWDDYNRILESICYEFMKMKIIRNMLYNYTLIDFSYIYECVYITYQHKDIYNLNETKYKITAQEAKQKISQIDSEMMMSSLTIIKTLKAINLENNNIDKDAAVILAKHLHHNNILEQLWLRGNELHDKGASEVLQSLLNFSTLLILDLSFNHLSSESADGIAAVISSNCLLQQLWLDGNDLTEGVVIITSALRKLSTLRILSLCSTGITDNEAKEISAVIIKNVLLVDLLLSNNQLEARGIIKIAEALRKSFMLRKLDLSDNHITPGAAKHLELTLTNCTNLQQLFFSNTMLKTKGTINIALALTYIDRLQVLSLSNNNIDESAAGVLANVLKRNISLKIVLINRNNLQTTGIKPIVKIAKNITTLQLLDVSNNNVSEDEKVKIKILFANTNILLLL